VEGDEQNQFESGNEYFKFCCKNILLIFLVVDLSVTILREAIKYYYYIHVFGFYRIILNKDNVDQLEQLLGDLTDLIYISNDDHGKIMFKFYDDCQENRNRIHVRIKELAFKPNVKDVQLPLITLPSNPLITANFYINTNMDWEKFRTEISFRNGLSASFWLYVNTERVEGQVHKLVFYIDGKSYSQIQEMRHELPLDNGSAFVEVNNDPYWNDIANLPFRKYFHLVKNKAQIFFTILRSF